MIRFTHLHVHSYYSFLDGICSPEELVLAAKKLGMKALALTDHDGLYGAIEFYQQAKEYGIKPIIGAEITLTDSSTLVLLVKDGTGYRNLCQLISRSRLQGGHLRQSCTIEDLRHLKEGLGAPMGSLRRL